MPLPASSLASGVNSTQYLKGTAKTAGSATMGVVDLVVLATMFSTTLAAAPFTFGGSFVIFAVGAYAYLRIRGRL